MSAKKVYQFKIALQRAPLPIWRRIQVPDSYSFWELHVTIQDAMGWEDCHLHDFEIINPASGRKERIGVPDPVFEDFCTKRDKDIKIRDFFNDQNTTATYVYDFGDGWRHQIKFEGIFDVMSKQKYPICIKGKNACPPEDVGGVWGYEDFLQIIKNPKHSDYEDMMEWIGESFDPYSFDPKEIMFDDPKIRWDMGPNKY